MPRWPGEQRQGRTTIDAAIYRAASGEGRDEVRNDLMMAIIKPDWQARVIQVMQIIGEPLELTLLTTVKGQNDATAPAAIPIIAARRQWRMIKPIIFSEVLDQIRQ